MSETTTQTEDFASETDMVSTGTSKPARKRTGASRKAEATQKPAASKPAAKPEGPSDRDKRQIVLSALIRAGADMIESWNDPRVTKTEARAFAAHRLSYCPPQCEWDDRLGPRTELASRSSK